MQQQQKQPGFFFFNKEVPYLVSGVCLGQIFFGGVLDSAAKRRKNGKYLQTARFCLGRSHGGGPGAECLWFFFLTAPVWAEVIAAVGDDLNPSPPFLKKIGFLENDSFCAWKWQKVAFDLRALGGGGILGAVIWGGLVITLIMFWSAGFMNLMLLSEFLRRNAKWKMNNVSMQFDPISQCARKCFATSARATFWCDDALPKCSRPGGLTPNWSIISKFLLGTTLGILQIQEIPQKFR